MILENIAVYALVLFLLIGSLFSLVGVIGLLKFNDPMTRLHAPTKVGTVGVGAFLVASFGDGWSMQELLIMIFLFVTAPISANFIAKVHMHSQVGKTPPPPIKDDIWSTLAVPKSDPPEE